MTCLKKNYPLPLLFLVLIFYLVLGFSWLQYYAVEFDKTADRLSQNLSRLTRSNQSDNTVQLAILKELFGNGISDDITMQRRSLASLINLETLFAVKNRLIDSGEDFVEADLSLMRLRFYRDGALLVDVPIVSKGREGSWWETPTGLYGVVAKEEKHFSSIGKVYMPWSVQFQGNFFIHGWPYYPDGTPVSQSYSGGCIRLANEDAKIVYDLMKKDVPILVLEKDSGNDEFPYSVKPPEVSAKAYLAADLKNGYVFAERDSRVSLPAASLVKLMTALTAAEYIYLERTIVITDDMITGIRFNGELKAGKTFSAFDLLHPMLVESSNDAANAISYFLGPKYFINLMNQKARSLNMNNTIFKDPSGLDDGNISTAQDLYQLARYLFNNRRFILDITKGKNFDAFKRTYFQNLKNVNTFYRQDDFIGGKVGYTEVAGETLVSVFNLAYADGNKRPVAIILLGSNDRTKDAEAILQWLKRVYF